MQRSLFQNWSRIDFCGVLTKTVECNHSSLQSSRLNRSCRLEEEAADVDEVGKGERGKSSGKKDGKKVRCRSVAESVRNVPMAVLETTKDLRHRMGLILRPDRLHPLHSDAR